MVLELFYVASALAMASANSLIPQSEDSRRNGLNLNRSGLDAASGRGESGEYNIEC